jgi:CRISPR/Cas system-associated exonuclease Cas4 (RecB family)
MLLSLHFASASQQQFPVMKDEHETVVVDFKFGKPKPEYHDQIKGYMKLLESMGHAHVKGYLWYVYPNKIEEVL